VTAVEEFDLHYDDGGKRTLADKQALVALPIVLLVGAFFAHLWA